MCPSCKTSSLQSLLPDQQVQSSYSDKMHEESLILHAQLLSVPLHFAGMRDPPD